MILLLWQPPQKPHHVISAITTIAPVYHHFFLWFLFSLFRYQYRSKDKKCDLEKMRHCFNYFCRQHHTSTFSIFASVIKDVIGQLSYFAEWGEFALKCACFKENILN